MGRDKYAQKRPTAPSITKELKKRMKYVDSSREGPHTFNRTDLIPLIAFGIEIASTYLLTKDFIVSILKGYSMCYGDVGVQLFLRQCPNWIETAMVLMARAIYDTPTLRSATPQSPTAPRALDAPRRLALPPP